MEFHWGKLIFLLDTGFWNENIGLFGLCKFFPYCHSWRPNKKIHLTMYHVSSTMQNEARLNDMKIRVAFGLHIKYHSHNNAQQNANITADIRELGKQIFSFLIGIGQMDSKGRGRRKMTFQFMIIFLFFSFYYYYLLIFVPPSRWIPPPYPMSYDAKQW